MIEEISVKSLLDLSHTLAAPLLDTLDYPFEALPKIGAFLVSLTATLPADKYTCEGDGIYISKTATVAGNASITGPCIIGHRAEIRH